MVRVGIVALFFFPFSLWAQNQPFYFGNDLSYVNQMEDCGAVYKEGGEPKDPFKIFADHGTNLVRVRLWKDPSWWQSPLDQPAGVKSYYNDLQDVKETIRRAKEHGMEVMLGIHYSDSWADPGNQFIPRSWLQVAKDPDALNDSVYHYTKKVLTELDEEGLMPNIVKIGNENNKGILMDIPEEDSFEIKETVSNDWARHARLFNTAIRAVRDVGASSANNPKIALHMSNDLSSQAWNYQNRFIDLGVTDFDIIGFSYYYAWHGGSIGELESTVSELKRTFEGYDIMAVETGYPWTHLNHDQLGNIVTDADPEYLPLSPERQLEYMIDYTRAVIRGGGTGVIFWEPAWVSTLCSTPWGIGSSHDHLAFFDPENTNFIENGGGRWTERKWYSEDLVKVIFRADMFNQHVSEGVYLMGDFTSEPIEMMKIDEDIYHYYTLMEKGTSGSFYFLNGQEDTDRETVPTECGSPSGRPFELTDQDMVFDYLWSSCEKADADRHLYRQVTFKVDITGKDKGEGAFITGAFTGDPWQIVPMDPVGDNLYTYTLRLKEGRTGAFHFLNQNDWGARETVPESCASWWGIDRGYEVGAQDETYFFAFGACDENLLLDHSRSINGLESYPNPAGERLHIRVPENVKSVKIYDLAGHLRKEVQFVEFEQATSFSVSDLEPGFYLVEVFTKFKSYQSKTIIRRK